MPAPVQNFINSVNRFDDLHRQSRFNALFPRIPGCCDELGNAMEHLSLRCEYLDLPGREFATFNNRTYGPSVKYPMQTNFPDITITFLLSGNKVGSSKFNIPGTALFTRPSSGGIQPNTGMVEKRIFENWMNYINTYPGGTPKSDYPYHNFLYKNEYGAEIQVQCYDVHDNPSYAMYFYNAFPISTGPVSMSWANEDVATLPVVFTYEYATFTDQCECIYPDSPQLAAPVLSTQQPRYDSSQEEIIDLFPESGGGAVTGGTGPNPDFTIKGNQQKFE